MQDFVFSVDELGSHLVVAAEKLVIGHSRGTDVDLPFLADVSERHAQLVRELSFRGGAAWYIAPIGDGRVVVGDRVPKGERCRLNHGNRVELGVNLSFRFSHPDPASTTAVLELERGTECLGNRAIVLHAEGSSGKLRLGSGSGCHLRTPRLTDDLCLRRSDGQLWFEGAVRPTPLAGSEQRGVRVEADRIRLDLPLDRRLDFQLGSASSEGPAFGIGLAPVPIS